MLNLKAELLEKQKEYDLQKNKTAASFISSNERKGFLVGFVVCWSVTYYVDLMLPTISMLLCSNIINFAYIYT